MGDTNWPEMLGFVESEMAKPDVGRAWGKATAGPKLLKCYTDGIVPAAYRDRCKRVLVGLGLCR